jgi:MFS family permease
MMKQKTIFLGACMGMLLFGVTLITLGSVATVLGDKFRLSGTETGGLFSILPFGILLGSMVFGPVSDAKGYKPVLTAAAFIICAGFQGIVHADTLPMLRICVLVFGFGGGIMNGATNAVVSDISGDNKAAYLNLLGVFFGLGALGMPLMLGLLAHSMPPLSVLSLAGWAAGILGFCYLLMRFPPPKEAAIASPAGMRDLIRPLLLLIGMFLFFQSSLEAVINNWSTLYVTRRGVMDADKAMFALSLHMAGMVAMRILSGTLLRQVPERRLLGAGLVLLTAGLFLMMPTDRPNLVVCGLVLTGAGLSAGFPVMLSIAGKAFPARSASAFSLVFTMALTGNMLVNYLMGLVTDHFGIGHLATVCLAQVAGMAILLYLVSRKITQQIKN